MKRHLTVDNVKWSAFFATFKGMGFSTYFCKIIHKSYGISLLLSTSRGNLHLPFKNEWGIRQGDPTIPNTLWFSHRCLVAAHSKQNCSNTVWMHDTYQVNGSTSISYLMYANDVLLFTKTNRKSLMEINRILEEFNVFIGLLVNTGKNSITLNHSFWKLTNSSTFSLTSLLRKHY